MVLLQECSTRVPQRRGSLAAVTSPGLQWACRWRCHSGAPSLPCERLTLPGTDLLGPLLSVQLHRSSQHLRGESLQPSTATVQSSSFIYYHSSLRPAAIIAGDLNLHRGLRDRHLPSTTGGEDLSSTLIDMDFGLANDPAQATRITHRNVPSPDVAAYRVPRVTHWQSTPCMDSDRCLISYSVGMDEGVSRLANTLPRREKATFALRKADWPAFTSLCETLLAAASTWLDIRSGILRAAERHIPRGSRDSSKTIWTNEMNKPSPPQKQHTKHTRRLARRQPASSRIHPKSGGPKSSLTPWLHYASGSPRGKTWGLIQPEVAISSRHGGAAPSSPGIGGAPN
ncbi:hypothetical protein TcBrA4_0126550 [Trypanosoma cruzi]|nr:hypothetical protein TcBrA4_0126550 [Trypanosoma cruzi]